MWHVSSRSGVATLRTAILRLRTYLLTFTTPLPIPYWPIGRYRRSKHRKSMIALKLAADTPLRQLTTPVRFNFHFSHCTFAQTMRR